jgi:hypothetical protein
MPLLGGLAGGLLLVRIHNANLKLPSSTFPKFPLSG